MARKKLNRERPPAADLGGLELDARRAGRVRTLEVLRGGRTPLQLVEAARSAVATADEALRKAASAQPPPALACKEGCDWCCYFQVGANVAEVVRIAVYLRQTLPPDELRAARERVARLDDRKRPLPPAERRRLREPCPLLAGRRCLAYPVRPLTCRGFNSADAGACERSVKGGGRIDVPAYEPQMRLTAFVLDGARAGLAEAGLKSERVELTAALRIVLENPDAVDRWLAGEPVFAAARLD